MDKDIPGVSREPNCDENQEINHRIKRPHTKGLRSISLRSLFLSLIALPPSSPQSAGLNARH